MAETVTIQITHKMTIEKAETGDFYVTGADGKRTAVRSVAGLYKAVDTGLNIVKTKRGPRAAKAEAPAETPTPTTDKGKDKGKK
jgi:accessory colonization factor AcfC